jgi:hypothetical protein
MERPHCREQASPLISEIGRVTHASASSLLRVLRWDGPPTRRRVEAIRSRAPSGGPAPRVCLPGGAPAVAPSSSTVLAGLLRNWQSIPLQGGASSSFRGAEGMRHSRREYAHPLLNRRAVSPMTPNRALNRTLNQRRCACWFRAG